MYCLPYVIFYKQKGAADRKLSHNIIQNVFPVFEEVYVLDVLFRHKTRVMVNGYGFISELSLN